MIGKTSEFLSNVKKELSRVTWPSKKEAYGSTVVVIVLVLVIAAFLGVLDWSLSNLIRILLG